MSRCKALGAVVMAALVGCSSSEGEAPSPDPVTVGAGAGGSGGSGGSSTSASGGSEGLQGYASGSRLKAKVLNGEDGSVQPWGWYDSELGLDCSPVVASDGVRRCLPNGAPETGRFADSDCTEPLYFRDINGCPDLPSHVRVTQKMPCEARTAVYPMGPEVTLSTVYSGALCSPTPPPAGYVVYQLGPAMPPSDFVAFTGDTL